jgi:hypothetical protein
VFVTILILGNTTAIKLQWGFDNPFRDFQNVKVEAAEGIY